MVRAPAADRSDACGLLAAAGAGRDAAACGRGLAFRSGGLRIRRSSGTWHRPRAQPSRGRRQFRSPICATHFSDASRPTEHWLVISESLARRGKTQDAAGVLQSAVREHPGDPALWIGLGNALADHAGTLTPASDLAYRRAIELSPDYPAPRFFYGLALARSGDGEGGHRLVAANPCGGASRCQLAPLGRGCDRGPRRTAARSLRPRPARKEGRAPRRRPGGGSCRPTR